MLGWDDRILSFELCVVLVLLVGLTILVGEALMLLPWGTILEYTFRLAGLAAFGPHM